MIIGTLDSFTAESFETPFKGQVTSRSIGGGADTMTIWSSCGELTVRTSPSCLLLPGDHMEGTVLVWTYFVGGSLTSHVLVVVHEATRLELVTRTVYKE
jgi:hypothetical protein